MNVSRGRPRFAARRRSTSITADLYSHVLPAVAADAAEQIARLVPRAAAVTQDVTAM